MDAKFMTEKEIEITKHYLFNGNFNSTIKAFPEHNLSATRLFNMSSEYLKIIMSAPIINNSDEEGSHFESSWHDNYFSDNYETVGNCGIITVNRNNFIKKSIN